MRVTSSSEITVVVLLETWDERFRVFTTWGRKRQPVLVDRVRVIGGSKSYAVASGYRLRKDGTLSQVRAPHIPVQFTDLPNHVYEAVLAEYSQAALDVPSGLRVVGP